MARVLPRRVRKVFSQRKWAVTKKIGRDGEGDALREEMAGRAMCYARDAEDMRRLTYDDACRLIAMINHAPLRPHAAF